MPIRHYITTEWLREENACGSEVRHFEEVFHERKVLVNKKNLLTASKNELPITWLCYHLFGSDAEQELEERTKKSWDAFWDAPGYSPEEEAALQAFYVDRAEVMWDIYQRKLQEEGQ